MQIFVSIHLIPSDLIFYPDANPPNYSNEEQIIEKGAMVRIKIMGLRMQVKDIVSVPVPGFASYMGNSSQSAPLRKITLAFFDNIHITSISLWALSPGVVVILLVFGVEDTPL